MWRKKSLVQDDPKVVARVQKLVRSDLIAWADQAIYTVGRNLTAYERTGSPENLQEAYTGAQVLLAIVREVERRDTP